MGIRNLMHAVHNTEGLFLKFGSFTRGRTNTFLGVFAFNKIELANK
jgi:hypothetical protein